MFEAPASRPGHPFPSFNVFSLSRPILGQHFFSSHETSVRSSSSCFLPSFTVPWMFFPFSSPFDPILSSFHLPMTVLISENLHFWFLPKPPDPPFYSPCRDHALFAAVWVFLCHPLPPVFALRSVACPPPKVIEVLHPPLAFLWMFQRAVTHVFSTTGSGFFLSFWTTTRDMAASRDLFTFHNWHIWTPLALSFYRNFLFFPSFRGWCFIPATRAGGVCGVFPPLQDTSSPVFFFLFLFRRPSFPRCLCLGSTSGPPINLR